MRSVTYSMGVSLDGYIAGPHGDIDWTEPDEEEFRFVTDEIREVGVHLLGRRLYETMLYWETADQDPSLDDSMLEWATIWNPLPKVVFSTTLSAVQGNARLASGGLAEEIERLRAEPGEGEIAIGGASLAAEAAGGDPVTFDGEFYQVTGLNPRPHQHHRSGSGARPQGLGSHRKKRRRMDTRTPRRLAQQGGCRVTARGRRGGSLGGERPWSYRHHLQRVRTPSTGSSTGDP